MKIAFCTSLNNIGGTEVSLINLLNKLPENTFDITLILIGFDSKLRWNIPKWVKIDNVAVLNNRQYLIKAIKSLNFRKIFNCLRNIIRVRFNKKTKTTMLNWEKSLYLYEKKSEIYDIVISWNLPNSIHNVYSLYYINARKRILWIHLDVSKIENLVDSNQYFEKYNEICCVSKSAKTAFDLIYPNCRNKTRVVYNIINSDEVKTLSLNPTEIDSQQCFKIITCGRLSSEKQPFYAIEIVKMLLRRGYDNFKWYFVGDGKLYYMMNEKIRQEGLQDYILLLGYKENPYAYISKCDLYVQMSSHESFCLALAEAQLIGIPSISTNFPSAYEIVDDNYSGYIVENDFRKIFEKIEHFLNCENDLKKKRRYLSNKEFHCIGDIN